jgi:hypothetical protein
MVEHKFIPADIAFFFQKKLTGHAADIGAVLGLHQAGHEQRLVVPDAARLPLEADIGGVLLAQIIHADRSSALGQPLRHVVDLDFRVRV